MKTQKFMNLCDFTEFLVQISHTFLGHDFSYLSPNELKALQRYIPASLRLGFLILKIVRRNKRKFNCFQYQYYLSEFQVIYQIKNRFYICSIFNNCTSKNKTCDVCTIAVSISLPRICANLCKMYLNLQQ